MKMTRIMLVLSGTVALNFNFALAQSYAPRSVDYMFAATANDARAIWVNPAGLATVSEASLMAEVVWQNPIDDGMRLSQMSFGFNSQGLSFGYYRERLVSDSSNNTYRLAMARALQNWALGVSVSRIHSGDNDTGFDAGIRYRLLQSIQLGVVVRNIGQPLVRADTLPLTAVASVGWTALAGHLTTTGELVSVSRLEESGYDMIYRFGADISFGRTVPVAGLASVTFGNDLGQTLWTFGLSVGGTRRGVAVAGLAPNNSSLRVETMSLTGVATNPLSGLRN
jgi:hypothetical protein